MDVQGNWCLKVGSLIQGDSPGHPVHQDAQPQSLSIFLPWIVTLCPVCESGLAKNHGAALSVAMIF